MGEDLQTIFGRKACMAVFRHRPQDIRRVFYRREGAGALGEMLKWAAANKRVYREVPEDELGKLAKSNHHEGLVIVADSMRYEEPTAALAASPGQWMALDRVENPHNLGAILRTAAFFGLQGVLVGGVSPGEKVNGAALRVAQGGAEGLTLCATPSLSATLRTLSGQGWQVLGLETGGQPIPSVLPLPSPWMLVAGHEGEGLSSDTKTACGALIEIQGAGSVGSLNVSVAVGVALASLVGGSQPG